MSGTEADSTPWAPSLSLQVLGAKPRPGIPAAHPTQTRGLVTQIPSRGPGPGQRGPPSTKLRVQTARQWTVTSLFSETKRDTESTREGSWGGRPSPEPWRDLLSLGSPKAPGPHKARLLPQSGDLPAPDPHPRVRAERRAGPQRAAEVMAKGGYWLPPLITSSAAYQPHPGPAWL